MSSPAPAKAAALPLPKKRYLATLLYEREAQRLSRNLPAFIREAWQVLEPTRPLLWNWHYDLECEHLLEATLRLDRKKIFNVPPRTGKSRLATVLWPVWNWTRTPSSRWIFISYAKDLTLQHSRERRDLIESEWFRRRWGLRFALAGDQNVKSWYDNTLHGSMFSSSIGGTVTGMGGDFIVVDDPHDPAQALSDADRATAIEFVDQTLSTRMDDPKTGVQVIVMQRLHEDDVSGHLLAQGGWTHINLPMEAEGQTDPATGEIQPETLTYPLTGAVHVRQPGELLMPHRFGSEEVRELKRRLGTWASATQLQQRPTPLEGGLLKRSWWKEYALPPVEQATLCETIIESWDMAFKETTDSDYVVGSVWGKEKGGSNIYLLDLVRDRMDFPPTIRAVRSLSAKWPQALAKLVEQKANGPAVLQQLKNEIPGLIGVEVKDSKEARVAAYSPAIEAGNVWLPRPEHAPWVHDFIEECSAFPRGANDDQVDTMTQALARLIGHRQFDLKAWAAERERREARLAKGLPPEDASDAPPPV